MRTPRARARPPMSCCKRTRARRGTGLGAFGVQGAHREYRFGSSASSVAFGGPHLAVTRVVLGGFLVRSSSGLCGRAISRVRRSITVGASPGFVLETPWNMMPASVTRSRGQSPQHTLRRHGLRVHVRPISPPCIGPATTRVARAEPSLTLPRRSRPLSPRAAAAPHSLGSPRSFAIPEAISEISNRGWEKVGNESTRVRGRSTARLFCRATMQELP
jgi:hypothetical protein